MSTQGPSPWSPADVAELRALRRGPGIGRLFSYVLLACIVFAAFAAYAFLTNSVYKATAVVGMPPSAPLPPPGELARRFHDAVVDGELLEQIAREGENVSEVVATNRLPNAVEVSALDARTFIVSFSDSAPERAQHLCNWIAQRIVRATGSMLATAPPGDSSKTKPVQRLTEQLNALLESSPSASSAQPPADAPAAPDLVGSVLQAERVRLSRRIEQLSTVANPYDAPELDSVKRRIGELDRAIVARRQSLQRPGTTARISPDVEKRLHELVQAAADAPDQEPPPDRSGEAKGARVIVDATLPTEPVEPNRRLVLLIGLVTSLATTLTVAIVRRGRAPARLGTELERSRDVPAPTPLATAVPLATPAPPAPRESSPPPVAAGAQQPVPVPSDIPDQTHVVFERTYASPIEPEWQRIPAPRFHPASITLITQPFGSPTAPLVAPRERTEVYTVVSPTGPEAPIPRPSVRRVLESTMRPPEGPLRHSAVPIGSLRTASRTATTQTFGKPLVPEEGAPQGFPRDRPRGQKLPLPSDSRRGANGKRSDRPTAPPESVPPDDPNNAHSEDSPTTPRRSSAPPRVTARISPLDLSTRFHPDRSLSPAARGTLKDSILPHSQQAGFVVGIVSGSMSRTEKSRVAAELTLALTESGERRVLLVEGDAEEPSVQRLMGVEVPMSAGFSLQLETHVPGLAEPESWTVVHCSKWLDLLAEGGIRSDEALLTRKFRSCVMAIKDHYDIVVINGPLLTQESECRVLDGVADGIVIVGGRGEPSVRERAERLLSPKCFTAVVAA
jgi:Mrp family chromosome partitioning ATPase/capsular polysaccharide biosynthesis protein